MCLDMACKAIAFGELPVTQQEGVMGICNDVGIKMNYLVSEPTSVQTVGTRTQALLADFSGSVQAVLR